MNRGFTYILAVPVFFVMVFFTLQLNYVNEEQRLFEEYTLAYAVDYATDAAAQELLETADIGVDYQDWGRINIDPNTALTTFKTMMLMSYDYPLTDKAFTMIEMGYMPVFCVASYDGYYMYTVEKDEESGYHLQGSNKIPYGYQDGDTYYALNLGMDNCRKLSGGKLTINKLAEEGISSADVLFQVNSQVSDDLAYAYQEYQENVSPSGHLSTIYIPQGLTTMTSVNAIDGPTVISIIDDWDINTTHKVDAFSIGGAKLEPQRMVAGYIDKTTGQKLYAYADLLPKWSGDDDYELDITKLFTDVVSAAQDGYYYDPVYMG